MAEKCGFFNALNVDGVYDRKYNANDYSDNLAAIISNGVRRSGNNDLKVTADGTSMALSIAAGWAFIDGKYYHNNSVYSNFTVPTAPTGERSRIDRIVLRKDESTSVRDIKLVYLTGTAATTPTAPALTRSGDIYELAIADITVNAGVTSISQSNIADQRANAEVCGWVTSPVGYDNYWEAQDDAFETWFTGVKDTLSSVTLFKEYHWSGTFAANGTSITFDVPQYDPTGVDIVQVYVNGLREIPTTDYTINHSTITFTSSKITGTEVHVVVYKSIDGTGLGSVSDEITALQNEVAELSDIGEYAYICNGTNDNVKISEIAQAFINGGTDYKSMTLKVYGDFGCTAAYAGSGTPTTRFRWFSLGKDTATNRRLTVDFSNCSQISLPIANGTSNIVFYGNDVNVIGANVIASNTNADTSIVAFNSNTGAVNAENCRFWFTANKDSFIASNGTFKNCRASVANSGGNSYCFNVHAEGLLRVDGGEFYAYAGGSNTGAVVYQANTSSVSILYAMNCPTIARSGYAQTNAVQITAGLSSVTDTVTTLTVAAAGGNIRGTLAANKPGRM